MIRWVVVDYSSKKVLHNWVVVDYSLKKALHHRRKIQEKARHFLTVFGLVLSIVL